MEIFRKVLKNLENKKEEIEEKIINNRIATKITEKIEKIKSYPYFTSTKLRYLKNIPSTILKKIGICLIAVFAVIILFFITSALTNSANKNQKAKNQIYKIEKKYWGTWQSFTNYSELKIDGNCVSKKVDGEFKKMQNSIVGYELDSNILTNGSSRYFRKNKVDSSFSMFIESKNKEIYPVSIKLFEKGVTRFEQKTIKQDTSFRFENVLSDNPKHIIVDCKNGFHEEFDVFPQYDGEFLGKVPIINADSWALKTSYNIEVDDSGFCYGNLYDEYALVIKLENIGNGIFEKGTYEISSSDEKLSFVEGKVKIGEKTFETSSLEGECGKIENGFYAPLYFKIKYGSLEEEKKTVPIQISLTDSNGKKQTDTISIQFHKGKIPIFLNSKNQIKNSTSVFTPIIIYPNGIGKKIETESNRKKTFFVPWSENDYTLIFTGANVSGDIAYSFSLNDKSKLPLIPEKWTIKEMKNYEPNDSVENALKLSSLKNICSYLRTDDVDCFSFNTCDLRNKFMPTSFVSYSLNDQIKEGLINNGDEKANPGEEISLDIKIRNITKQTLKDVKVEFFCDSEIAKIISEPKKIGDIPSSYYASGYSGSSKSSNVTLNAAVSKTCVLKLNENIKANVELPIKAVFSDSSNNIWTETFYIPIDYSDFKVLVTEIECIDSEKEGLKNNNDGFIQPGETLFMDLKLQNVGKSGAVKVKAKLISLSDYITIKKGEADFYNLAINCFKTGNYISKYGETSNGSKNKEIKMDGENGTFFIFEVSPSTPKGIEIPMQIELSDFSGNLIKKNFSITIDDYEETENEEGTYD